MCLCVCDHDSLIRVCAFVLMCVCFRGGVCGCLCGCICGCLCGCGCVLVCVCVCVCVRVRV